MKRKFSKHGSILKKRRGVAVTGLGIISSIGQSIEEFSQSLKLGRSGIGFLNSFPADIMPAKIGAQIHEFSLDLFLKQYSFLPEEFISRVKKCGRRSPYSLQCSMAASIQAWEMAGMSNADISDKRIGVIVAGSNISQNLQYSLFEKFQQTPEYLTPSYALHFMDTDQVGTLSEIFGIHGEGFNVGGASASGNVAIIKAFQLIQHGFVDACIVVGALADLSPMELVAFCNIGAMGGKKYADEPEKACRPFDREHEGFIFGQASACIVLESLQSAEIRGIRVLAEVMGGAISLDGNSSSQPNEDGEANVMECALEQSEITPEDVDYINAHGTSTPLGDEIELKAIKRVFSSTFDTIYINSTKGLTGHCLYSSGVVEAVATIIQMNEKYLHPNINLQNPIDTDLNFTKDRVVECDNKIALSNSFGFGGINTSIIIRKG